THNPCATSIGDVDHARTSVAGDHPLRPRHREENRIMRLGGLSRQRRAVAAIGVAALCTALAATGCASEDEADNNSAVAGAATTSLPDDPATGAPVRIGFVSTEGGAVISLPE